MPPNVFHHCENLVIVEFSERIEDFVNSTSLQSWWNRGVSKFALETYCLLSQYRITERFGKLQPSKWRLAIDDLLEVIPNMHVNLRTHFFSIESKLSNFEELSEIAVLLELALWKAKLIEDGNLGCEDNNSVLKIQWRVKCGADVIIPKVLLFLMLDASSHVRTYLA